MFAKTSIALALIVAICSGAVAAEKRQGSANAFGNHRTITHCLYSVWDAYGLRCDPAE
jgi:hypothetical protein